MASFYDVKTKRRVTVPNSSVKTVRLKNGRKAAVASYRGRKLYRFVKG
jgi:hypothetical protein